MRTSLFSFQIVLLWYHENIIFLCNPHSNHSPSPTIQNLYTSLTEKFDLLRSLTEEKNRNSAGHPKVVFSVQLLSCVRLFATPWTAAARLHCPLPTLGACSNSCPSSQWCLDSSSVIPFSSCLQSFQASGSFQMSQFFVSGSQSNGVLASASVLPMNILDWFPLGWTGWISLQSEGLSRVFSITTVQKHQFFGTQLSLWSNSHTHTWPLEKL